MPRSLQIYHQKVELNSPQFLTYKINLFFHYYLLVNILSKNRYNLYVYLNRVLHDLFTVKGEFFNEILVFTCFFLLKLLMQ